MKDKNSDLNSSLKLLAKTAFLVFVGLAFSKLFAYAYRIIIARSFGPETYGMFTLALMIIGWFTVLATVGLTQGVSRYIALYRGKGSVKKIR